MKDKRNELETLLSIIANPSIRKALKIINEENAITYSDLAKRLKILPERLGFDEQITDEYKKKRNNSTRLSYYFRKLDGMNLVTKREHSKHYTLTRKGVVCMNLLDKFEEIIAKYENDKPEDAGEIKTEISIVGREVESLDEVET